MISFEVNGYSKIIKEGINLPDLFGYNDIDGFLKIIKLKVYINGKRCRRKMKQVENGWRFIRPLKLTEKDIITYTWEQKL